MAREESVIFRFVTEGKDRVLRDFAEVDAAKRRVSEESVAGGAGAAAAGQRGAARPRAGSPITSPASEAPHRDLGPIGPGQGATQAAVKADPAIVQMIQRIISETLREAVAGVARQGVSPAMPGGGPVAPAAPARPAGPSMFGPAGPARQFEEVDLPLSAIRADPARFQWRPEANQRTGSSGRLSGVRQFSYNQADIIDVVPDDRNPGGYIVVEGHNRVARGQRSIAEGFNPPDQPIRARVLTGLSDEEALRYGARRNILAGNAEPREIAAFNRRIGITGEQFLADPQLNRDLPKNIQGAALTDLAPDLYDLYNRRRLSEGRAVAFGQLGVPPSRQMQLYQDIQALGGRQGRQLTDDEFAVYLRRASNAATVNENQIDMFGGGEVTRSTLNERVLVEGGVLGQLRSSRTALRGFGNEARLALAQQAGVVEGNVNAQAARDLARQADTVVRSVEKLADTQGSLVDRLLNVGAEQVAGGGDLQTVIGNVISRISDPSFLGGAARNAWSGGGDVGLPDVPGGTAPLATTEAGRSDPRRRRARATEEDREARRAAELARRERVEAQLRERDAADRRRADELDAAVAAQRGSGMSEERLAAARAGSRDIEAARARDEWLAGLTPDDLRDLRAAGVTVPGMERLGGAGGGGRGGPPPGAFDTSGIPPDPLGRQAAREETQRGNRATSRLERGLVNLRTVEQRIQAAVETLEGIRGGASPYRDRATVNRGITALNAPQIGPSTRFDPTTGQITTGDTGVLRDELINRLRVGLEERENRGLAGRRSEAALREAREQAILGIDTQQISERAPRLDVLDQQRRIVRDRLRSLQATGRPTDDREVQALQAQFNQISEQYTKTNALGKMGFGVEQEGFVGALQKASFRAFPFTIGAFAVQSGGAPLVAGATQFQQAYQQYGRISVEESQSRRAYLEAQTRLGEQGAGVTRSVRDFGTNVYRAIEPVGGGALVAAGSIAAQATASGLNVLGLVVAFRELAGAAKGATAGLGGLGGLLTRLGATGGVVGAVAGAAVPLGLGAAAAAAGLAAPVAVAAYGPPQAPVRPSPSSRGRLGGPADVVGTLQQVLPYAQDIPALVGGALGVVPQEQATRAIANIQRRMQGRQGATTFGPPDSAFEQFEREAIDERLRQEASPIHFAYGQARLRESQAGVQFAQFQRAQAAEERADQRAAARLDQQQTYEISQITRQGVRQRDALTLGAQRQERQANLGFERGIRDLGQQRQDAYEDIGIQSGQQIGSIRRGLGRSLRDIGIGETEGREDIQRNLGRNLAGIDRQAGRSREEIERNFGRGMEDTILGQIGGMGGDFIRLAVGRARALEDLEREKGVAREDAERAAAEAGEDLGLGSGRARARAIQGAGDAEEEVGIGAGQAREAADRAYTRGGRNLGQQLRDQIADIGQGYQDALTDLTTATMNAVKDRQEAQKIEREQLAAELEERRAIRQQLLTDMQFQKELVATINQNMSDQQRIYDEWNKAIVALTKNVNLAADNVKIGAARALAP